MDKVVSLADFADVVRQLADGTESEFVVIGGLAVGAWAQYLRAGKCLAEDIGGTRSNR